MVNAGRVGVGVTHGRAPAAKGRLMTTITDSPSDVTPPLSAEEVAVLITALQSEGLRVQVPVATRTGGAGPADAGMLYIEGVPATVPTTAEYVAESPYTLRGEDDGGWGV